MKNKVALLAAVSLVSFAAGWTARRGYVPPARTRGILYWRDPMHPAYRSDQPGVAPDCGMPLEPVYDDAPPANRPPSGTLSVDPVQQQLIGVRMITAERSGGRRMVRCVGRVAAEEGRVYRVSPGVDGWIRRVEGGATGSAVRRDQTLAVFGSRDILSPQQAYLYALEGQDRLAVSDPDAQQVALVKNQLEQATQALEAVGLSGPQLRELARTRTPSPEIQLSAPTSGVVLRRDAEVGQRFERYAELFRIADLSRVWVLAEVYPQDVAFITRGRRSGWWFRVAAASRRAPARRRPCSTAARGRSRCGLRPTTRGSSCGPRWWSTSSSRRCFPKASWCRQRRYSILALRTIVYVDRGEGRFEARRVETGWRAGERIEIKAGSPRANESSGRASSCSTRRVDSAKGVVEST